MRKLTRHIRTRATCVDPSLLARAHCGAHSTTKRAAEIDWKIFEDLRRRQKSQAGATRDGSRTARWAVFPYRRDFPQCNRVPLLAVMLIVSDQCNHCACRFASTCRWPWAMRMCGCRLQSCPAALRPLQLSHSSPRRHNGTAALRARMLSPPRQR